MTGQRPPSAAGSPRGAPPGWLLDETAGAGRENLDPAHAARYDGKEDADAAGEVALLAGLGMTEGSVVVEFGPGTGQFTVAVAPACARVTAVDVSEPMLSQLRAKADRLGVRNLEIIRAGFLSYRHEGPPADFVYSRFALHHLPDFWKAVALARVRRMVRAGGILRLWDVVFSFEPHEAFERIEAWCASAGAGAQAGWSRAELEEHVRDEHSTFAWLLEPMLARAGFAPISAEYSDDGIFARYVLRAE